MMRSRLPCWPRWPLLLALGATTCQRPASGPAAPPAPPTTTPAAEPAEPTPAAEPTHPLELVPARARAMLMARSPQRLAEIWERDRFAAEFPAVYSRMIDDVQHALGHDPLDPAGLAALGLDPSAPIGVALLNAHDEAFMVFGGCSDPGPLVAALERASGAARSEREVGEARLLRMDEELTLVLRHGMFALVLVDRQREGQPDYPLEVARIDPARSLAHAPSMERGHAGLPAEVDVQGLLDVAGLVHDELELSRRSEQRSIAEANRRLVEARQRGASAEEIDSLQQQLQSEQQFMARMRRQRQIGEMLLSRTLGSIEGIGLAVDADAQGLRGRIHMALSPDSVFRALLVSTPRAPAALQALGDAPQVVLSGQVNVGVAIDLLAQLMLMSGTTYAEANEELRDELKVDFDRDIRPRLTGEGTFVLTSQDPVLPTEEDAMERALGGILALGVDDEAAAREVLAPLPSRLTELTWAEAPEIHGWSVRLPSSPLELWIGVGAGQVAIGTDRAAIVRLHEGKAGSASTHLPHPEPWQHLTEGSAAARLAMTHRIPVLLGMRLFARFESFDFPEDVDFLLMSEFPDDDIQAIPRSSRTERLQRKVRQAWEDRALIQERARQERIATVWNRMTALGITAGSIRHTPTGLMAEGGHYVDGGMGGYARALVQLSQLDDVETSMQAQLDRAQQAQDRAQQRLLEARRKEIQRALAKGHRPKHTPISPPEPHV